MSEKPDSGALDIANVIKLPLQDITDEMKCNLIKNRLPDKDFKFPPKQYKDSSETGGVKQRHCLRDIIICPLASLWLHHCSW